MTVPLFDVKRPGLLTTIQDLGRHGFQQYGIVVSGAMDHVAHRIANLLVGNEPTMATLEVTMMGPKLTAVEDTVIALTGANLSATIDGVSVPLWKSTYVKKGQTLSFGKPVVGLRAYIAVAGGFVGEDVLGSQATYLKAKMGGVDGREVRKGDVLYRGEVSISLKQLTGRALANDLRPCYDYKQPFQVIVGPDDEMFTRDGLSTFFSEDYEITQEVDRMGCRLSGPKIEHKNKADIISDAITVGTIQVPASGQPIILLADRQTSGGYTRIGTVATVDIPRLVQQISGTKIRFEPISVEKAQQLYIKQEKMMKQLQFVALNY